MLEKIYYATATSSSSYHDTILKLIEDCKNEPNKDKKIKMLNQINSKLLKSDQLKIPIQLTNDYIYMALHDIEAKLLLD